MTEHGMVIIGIYCIDKKGKHLVNKGFVIFFNISYFKVILSCRKTLVHYEHSVSQRCSVSLDALSIIYFPIDSELLRPTLIEVNIFFLFSEEN